MFAHHKNIYLPHRLLMTEDGTNLWAATITPPNDGSFKGWSHKTNILTTDRAATYLYLQNIQQYNTPLPKNCTFHLIHNSKRSITPTSNREMELQDLINQIKTVIESSCPAMVHTFKHIPHVNLT